MKFATKHMWHCPAHFRYVAALPWEIVSQIWWKLHCAQLQRYHVMTTDDLGMLVSRDISWTVLWVWGLFSSLRALRCLPLPWRLSTVPVSLNFLSNLLNVDATCRPSLFGNSVLTCLALFPFNWYNFFIRILSSLLKTMFANSAVMLWRLGWMMYSWCNQVIAKINK